MKLTMQMNSNKTQLRKVMGQVRFLEKMVPLIRT